MRHINAYFTGSVVGLTRAAFVVAWIFTTTIGAWANENDSPFAPDITKFNSASEPEQFDVDSPPTKCAIGFDAFWRDQTQIRRAVVGYLVDEITPRGLIVPTLMLKVSSGEEKIEIQEAWVTVSEKGDGWRLADAQPSLTTTRGFKRDLSVAPPTYVSYGGDLANLAGGTIGIAEQEGFILHLRFNATWTEAVAIPAADTATLDRHFACFQEMLAVSMEKMEQLREQQRSGNRK